MGTSITPPNSNNVATSVKPKVKEAGPIFHPVIRPATATGQPQPLGQYLVSAGVLSPQDLERALEIQKNTRDRLGRILISMGLVRRYDLYQALALRWSLPFVDLLKQNLDDDLIKQFQLETMIQQLFMPFAQDDTGVHIATALQPSAELEKLLTEVLGEVKLHFYVTTEWDIDQVLRRTHRAEILDGAIYGLYFRAPHESAYTVFTQRQFMVLGILLVILMVCLLLWVGPTLIAINLFINIAFFANVLFRFVISLAGAKSENHEPVTQDEIAALNDDELPIYTILVPVYREAGVIGMLMKNLADLDYPREKLDILVLLEEDDQETIQAAKAAKPPGNVQLVVLPNQIPKTKPKACNVGLYFARGEFLVIYDAEDRPDPDQLKKAVAAFKKGPPNLVCVQAALNYFNANENFLTRMFTLEYSYWFDYMLPGLDRLKLPIPLGGTSNHFRTDALRELGGWDPFNVTEDADLGVRASAEGFTVGVINSTTYEEANTRAGNWVRQRSRWIKGYMQTSLVHLRAPHRLVKQVGWRNAAGFLLLVVGTPLTFLAAPLLWIPYLIWIVTDTRAFDPLFLPLTLYLSLFNLLIGNGLAINLSMMAVFKRKLYYLIPWALLNPVYWLLHSIASYKALYQLFTRPFFWEKTLHGISKSTHTPAVPVAPVVPAVATPTNSTSSVSKVI